MAEYLKFNEEEKYIAFNANKNEALFAPLHSKNNGDPKKKDKDTCKSDGKNESSRETKIGVLHIALLIKSNASMCNLLLRHKYKFALFNCCEEMIIRDSAGRTPLIIACMHNYEKDIIKQLLLLDQDKRSVLIMDSFNNTPLHYACGNKYANVDIVKMLLDAEAQYQDIKKDLKKSKQNEYISLPTETTDVEQQDQREHTHGNIATKGALFQQNKHNMTPLKLAVKEGAPIPVLKILLEHMQTNLGAFDLNTSYVLCQRVEESRDLQDCINQRLSERYPCFILMASLNLRISVFVSMVVATEELLRYGEGPHWFVPCLFYVYLIIEVLGEMFELCALGAAYFLRRSNFFDNTRIVLVGISLRIFDQQMEAYEQTNKVYILLCAGVLLGIDIIVVLRSTFLPFAKFSGGIVVIVKSLIPFFIVSIIFLTCFTYIFRVLAWNNDAQGKEGINSMETECQISFHKCMFQVLEAFLSGGSEDHDRVVDTLFGLTIILVLLTIIIAIVSDAWGTAEKKASHFYWVSRISFLVDINDRPWMVFFGLNCMRGKESVITKVLERIDGFDREFFRENYSFSWTKDAPYNQVSELDEYYRPHEYFFKDDADKIKAAHSLNSEIFWIKNEEKEFYTTWTKIVIATAKWIFSDLSYCLLLVLGFCSGGLLWPNRIRRNIFSYGYQENKEPIIVDDSIDRLSKDYFKCTQSAHEEFKRSKEADPTTKTDELVEKLSSDLKTALMEYEKQLNTLVKQTEK